MNATSTFISYSWDSDDHNGWVRALAERLRADGVEADIDQWATVPGDHLPEFMERAIAAHAFVLIVCTPRYKATSEARQGGVQRVHRDTLILCVRETNRLVEEHERRQRSEREARDLAAEEHRRNVQEAAQKIRFDD